MFRPITAGIFFMAFLAQSFSGQLMMLGYYANRTAFAKNCENKAKPAMHCNGKCQLMKKMQQEDKKDRQIPERKSENKDGPVSSGSFFCSVENFLKIIHNSYPTIPAPPTHDRATSVFHPPQDLPFFAV
jgi:hypothetical protein